MLNEAGRITDTYRYNAYGELMEQTGDTENHYLYTGEYYDGTSNLYYLRARYMNPSTGTFISMDTYEGSIYDPDTLHKYLYANGNPVTPHAQKHAYNPNIKSTKNRTQFGENMDVAKLLEDTILNPDKIIYHSEHNIIKYVKEYDFNISTSDTPTGSHRVFISLSPKTGKTNRNSQFPYYGGDK